MYRDEMYSSVGDLIVLDNDETSDQRQNGGDVQNSMYVCSLLLLFRQMCGLEDEDGLGRQENAGGVEQL